jgi:hypothetical protein
MFFRVKITREQLIRLHIVSPTLFVKVVIIRSIDQLSLNVFIYKLIELRHSVSTNTVGTVYRSFDLLSPT